MKFSQRLNYFPEYVFSSLAKEVKLIEKKTGRKVLNFGIGSPDFPPSKIYIDKLKEYLDEPNSHLYPGYGATSECAEALQNWYKTRFGVEIQTDELFPLLGAKDGVSHLALALLDAEDEVLVPDPGYPGFSGPVLMVGAKPIYYNLSEKNNFKIDLQEWERKISSKTKFAWVNFPSNPTGQVASLEELEPLVTFAKKHDLLLVYDNAYSEITFDGFVAPSILQIEGAKDIAVEIGSFSKTFSFAGYRMGWIVGNSQVISALAKIKSQIDSGMSRPLQKIGAFALTNFDQKWHEQMVKSYNARREIISQHLEKIGLRIQKRLGSLYIWAKIPNSFQNSEEFSKKMLHEKQILLTPGTAFGKNGARFVRVSFCVNIDKISQYF